MRSTVSLPPGRVPSSHRPSVRPSVLLQGLLLLLGLCRTTVVGRRACGDGRPIPGQPGGHGGGEAVAQGLRGSGVRRVRELVELARLGGGRRCGAPDPLEAPHQPAGEEHVVHRVHVGDHVVAVGLVEREPLPEVLGPVGQVALDRHEVLARRRGARGEHLSRREGGGGRRHGVLRAAGVVVARTRPGRRAGSRGRAGRGGSGRRGARTRRIGPVPGSLGPSRARSSAG